MKSILSASVTLVLVLGVVVPVFGAEITGELVDQTCYAKDKANSVGVGHEECAMTCAMKGQTVAVVTDKGEVFAIAGELAKDNNAILVPHMSHRVVVTGEIVEKDGTKTITAVAVKMAGPRS